jgi:hypothetical protein
MVRRNHGYQGQPSGKERKQGNTSHWRTWQVVLEQTSKSLLGR